MSRKKPNITIPEAFAINGKKIDFDSDLIDKGFDDLKPDVLAGDNLNKLIDDTYKGINATLNLYKGAVLYDIDETYDSKSIIFNIDEDNNIEVYRSLIDENKGNDLTNKNAWLKISLGGGAGAYIGQTIFSLDPLFEDGLHLLDGGMVYGDGVYAEFVNTYIANLYTKHPERFFTEEQWQEHVNTYGVCGRYVYDTVANTVRLPKVTGIVEGTIDVNALGDLVEAGLPNIEGNFAVQPKDVTGAFFSSDKGSSLQGTGWGTLSRTGFDASLSNPIYGNSNTVQPQTIKGYYYIVLATEAKTKLEVDLDNIAVDLNNKVDKQNMSAVSVCIEEYVNGTSWYRIYSDVGNGKWCEQGGQFMGYSEDNIISLLKSYKDTTYSVQATAVDKRHIVGALAKTTTSIQFTVGQSSTSSSNTLVDWVARGYLA